MQTIVQWFTTFTAETWVALAASCIALAALLFTGIAAKAANDEAKIQRQLRIYAAQPYVWVDIRENRESGSFLQLELGNSGPTRTAIISHAEGQEFGNERIVLSNIS